MLLVADAFTLVSLSYRKNNCTALCMNKFQLTYNDRTLFHLLRHFKTINESALNCLLKRGYPSALINENLQLPGSKFYADFATDIKSLMLKCEENTNYTSTLVNGYIQFQFLFDVIKFPRGIGELGVVPIDELARISSAKPILKANRGQQLLHAGVAILPITHLLTLVVKPQTGNDFLITVFPGPAAMPLPKKGMNPVLLQQCKLYWESHVFLEQL